MTEKKVLQADVYDALELSALAFGGIGGGDFADEDCNPLCAFGHAGWASAKRTYEGPHTDMGYELALAGIIASDNDNAVEKINKRRGRTAGDRISFRTWCRSLNVVRGA